MIKVFYFIQKSVAYKKSNHLLKLLMKSYQIQSYIFPNAIKPKQTSLPFYWITSYN